MPDLMTPVIRSYVAEIDDVKPGERSVIAKINTGSIDRYRTVIEPRGMMLEAYRSNPVVLWEHGKDPHRGTMPIGRNVWIKIDRGENPKIIAKTQFRNDDYSQALFEAYRDGDLRGWSVNILPHDHGVPTRDEIRMRPELRDCQTIYRTSELAEYSAVAVPGNAETLTLLASRGIWIPEIRTMTESEGMEDGGALVKPKVKGKKKTIQPPPQPITKDAMDGDPDEDEDEDEDEAPETVEDGIPATGGGIRPVGFSAPEGEKPGDPANDEEPDADEDDDELDESQKRYITHDGSQWVVHAEDGKVLGKHPTKSEAVKQLQAIEAHKHAHERRLAQLPPLKGKPVAVILADLIGEIRSEHKRRMEILDAFADLMRGRV